MKGEIKMKTYGRGLKATQFTKKQVNVLYAKAKKGELKIEKFYIKNLYDLAEYYGYDSNNIVAEEEAGVLLILDSVFSGNLEEAQERIDSDTERLYNSLAYRYQKKADRSLIA